MNGSRKITLRFLAEPAHVNFGGKVHGGAVMKWIDQAGYTCAAGWTSEYCVTLYVGGLHFLQPIRVGEVVEVHALVIHTGRTSLHIAIDIYASDPRGMQKTRRCHCVVVFVALGDDGRPMPVPAWMPESNTDRALQQYALRLMELGKLMDSEMETSLALLEQAES